MGPKATNATGGHLNQRTGLLVEADFSQPSHRPSVLPWIIEFSPRPGFDRTERQCHSIVRLARYYSMHVVNVDGPHTIHNH